MEADINAFFSANTKWYNNLVNDIYWDAEEGKGKFAESYEEVNLTPEEKAFVDRIDARMTELRQHQFIQRDSYYLGNTNNIVNLFQFKDIDKEILEKLQQNNFVITKGNNLQLFHAYEENDYRQVPNFITTDLYLQAFHMYFSYILKESGKATYHSYTRNAMPFFQCSLHQAGRTNGGRIPEKIWPNTQQPSMPSLIIC